MQAWQAMAYGEEGNPADTISKLVLKDDVPVPVPQEGQVLIKVEIAGVNPIDWKLFSGGLHGIAPCVFPYSPCFDISGTVSAVGGGVDSVAVGDKVCVDTGLVETCKDPPPNPAGPCGGLAQYAIALADCVSKHALDVETAAGLPLAGLTAYQALFTGSASSFAGTPLGSLKAGEKLLILGGSTAVGQYAIQMAKDAGVHVTVTCSDAKMSDGTSKSNYLKKLGADATINYKELDWAKEAGADVDLIFDCVGSEDDWKKAPSVLKKGGDFVSIANFSTKASPEDVVNFKNFLLKSSAVDLDTLVSMVAAGKLTVLVDTVFEFKDAKEALEKSFSAGKMNNVMGKILVKVPQ